ncbi:7TM diverse intracellular signaling domain-containing protein [Spirochaetota bacterium]
MGKSQNHKVTEHIKLHGIIVYSLLFLFLFFQAVNSSQLFAISLNNDRNTYPLGSHLEVHEDSEKKYNINTIQNAPFIKPPDRGALNFGFTSSAIWARFKITIPPNNITQWFLEVGYPLIDKVELYMPDRKKTYTVKRYGDTFPFSRRDLEYQNFTFSLKTKPGTYTYYVRIESTGSISLPLTIHSQKKIIKKANNLQIFLGIFYGALTITMVVNLFIALYNRDKAFLFYSIYIVSFILVSLALSGTGFQYIWRNFPEINSMVPLILFICIFWVLMFTRAFLHTKDIIPDSDRIVLFLLAISILGVLASPFVPYSIGIRLGAFYVILLVPILLITGLVSLKAGVRQARFYLLAFSFFLLGSLITSLNRFGVLQSNVFTVWAFHSGTLLQVFCLSLALGDRINVLQEESETAQSKALEYHKQLADSLQRSDRLKDEFLNNLSHELKTPLQVMYSYAELIRDEDEKDPETLKSYGEKIYGNIDKLKTYIEDIVLITDLSSHPALNTTGINLSSLVNKCIDKYSKVISEKNLNINIGISKNTKIMADEKYMQKAIENVIKNAIQFNKLNGDIFFTAMAKKHENESDICISLCIEDSGIGIPPENIDDIWEKFYRVDNSLTYKVSGVGIGLFLAKRIIELHGGKIKAESILGMGSKFTITLRAP